MSQADSTQNIWVAIPVHNNAGTVRAIALECRKIIPNVLIIDDGSHDARVAELMADTGIEVITHETNRGKGQAILTAARAIQQRGGVTMIAIDGDGQHYPSDLCAFLPVIAEAPDAIVIGERDMTGENVPGSSRFGRKFSNFWLKVETGLDLGDTQSGFRAYPVGHILKLACSGRAYDFEVEVLARAAWAGLPIRGVSIKVWYPPREERISSFRPFLDNLRLTRRHTLLVTRRLIPWPHRKLVTSPASPPVKRRGNALGFWFFLTLLRFAGLRGAYGLLYFVCLYYALVDSSIVRATLPYLRRRFPGQGPLRQRWNVYRLFIAQGKCLIDRAYTNAGGKCLRLHYRDFDKAEPLIDGGCPFLLLTAHAGSWQSSLNALTSKPRRVHVLMRPETHPVRDEKMRLYTQSGQIRIINPENYLGGVLEIMSALGAGDIVSMMGDRDYNSKKVAVSFLGDTAYFPCGPFHIAWSAGCPVVVLLSAKTGAYDYEIIIGGVIELQPGESKQAFSKRGSQEYAAMLERYFQEFPLQNFLFQDVWNSQQ